MELERIKNMTGRFIYTLGLIFYIKSAGLDLYRTYANVV